MIPPARTLKQMIAKIDKIAGTMFVKPHKNGYTLTYGNQVIEYDTHGRLTDG